MSRCFDEVTASAPLYSPVVFPPLSSSAAQSQVPSATTSTDSLSLQQYSSTSSENTQFLTNVTRHHGQITLFKPENMGIRRSNAASPDNTATAVDAKGKAKMTISPAEAVAYAQSNREDIVNAVRNAGLFPPAAPNVGLAAPRPSISHQGSVSSSSLRAPLASPALASTPHGEGPLDCLTGGANASSISLPTTIASSTSASTKEQRLQNNLPEQKAVKKKKKYRKPIDGPSLPITSQTVIGSSSGSGTRASVPTATPATTQTVPLQSRASAPTTAATTTVRPGDRRTNGGRPPAFRSGPQGERLQPYFSDELALKASTIQRGSI